MDRKAAKELVHIQAWLDEVERVDEITQRARRPTLPTPFYGRPVTR